MKKNKSFVIGGGISGLIYAYYNPEYTIISPDIGGQLTHGIYKMTWVHHTHETEKLLVDLGLEVKPTKTLMGYYFDGKIHDDCPMEKNTQVIQRKMSPWNVLKNNFKIEDRTLSVPENFINTLDADFNEVIKILSSKVKVINDYVVKITPTKIITQNGEYEYENLVSTMPAPVFWKIYDGVGNSPTCLADPVTFIVSTKKPEWYDDKYEMVYIAEKYYYTRISYRGEGYYVYEFTGVMPEDVFISMYGGVVEKHFINTTGRIHTVENNPPQDNILFLGRFAEWVHSSKIQHVISKSL